MPPNTRHNHAKMAGISHLVSISVNCWYYRPLLYETFSDIKLYMTCDEQKIAFLTKTLQKIIELTDQFDSGGPARSWDYWIQDMVCEHNDHLKEIKKLASEALE